MITKINHLKSSTNIPQVKTLCESTINAISSAIYNGVTEDAQLEIERVALNNLFEGLTKYANNKNINDWLINQKRIYSVKNLGIRRAVNSLMEKEGKYNNILADSLNIFREQISQGIPEVLLLESFTSALSGYNYIPAVENELSAISQRVKKYKNDIDISKIIEVMKGTRSNYLIPLIEDVVDNYLNDKNEQSKSTLKECLIKFSYDPFVRDILNIVILDATQLQLEYANAECNIEERLFSPILYLGESETLFNIHGIYYIRKGNNINKVKKENLSNLDENFINICNLINQPNIEISRKDIRVYMNKDNAIINESNVIINGTQYTKDQINEQSMAVAWATNKEFFQVVNTLNENFNEIAELDFVKRVYLKENENYAADIFKLRDNIFITTIDPINNKTTFYRNINPIQAEKIMMEHMKFDVSKTFNDILPNKEKIISEINETKKEYSDYINMLESKINQFLNDNSEVSKNVIVALKEELTEVKSDYKNYLNEVESFTCASSINENLNITVQDDGTGKSYTVVVPTGAMAARGSDQSLGGDERAEGDKFGTEVGMSSIQPDGASSAITFDNNNSELLSDEPSIDSDKIDMDADNLEAYADKVDAESELEKGKEGEKGTESEEGEENGMELDLGGENSEETPAEETPVEETPAEETPKGEEEPIEEKPTEETEETVGAPNKNLEKTNFNKDKNPDDLNEPKKIKKVFLKRPKK
ncbi:hypothetical protein M0Q50_04925 [bacterium]|jgi:hypothetical protein|nr:hypothetical protein [bacterium]